MNYAFWLFRRAYLACMLTIPVTLGFSHEAVTAQVTSNDATCFLVSNMFVSATDATAKDVAVKSAHFYLGRFQGTSAQIEAALLAANTKINSQNAASTMTICAQAMARRATELKAIGQRLSGQSKR